MNSIIDLMFKTKLLTKEMSDRIREALGLAFQNVYGDSFFTYGISGSAKLSLSLAFKDIYNLAGTETMTIVIDCLMFELMAEYYKLENPTLAQVTKLLSEALKKVDDENRKFAIAQNDSVGEDNGNRYLRQFKAHIKFFLYSLFVYKRPIEFGSISIRDKWNIFYYLIYCIRKIDPKLADELYADLILDVESIGIFCDDQSEKQSILSTLDFLYYIIHDPSLINLISQINRETI
jgi:hypothetical protein